MLTPNVEEIQGVIALTELREALATHSARINAELSRIAISPTTLYCAKTGAPIGEFSSKMLSDSLQSLGRERFEESLFLATGQQCNRAWFFTDTTNLDAMINQDPHGYAVYCLNLLTGHYLDKAKWTDTRKVAAHHWALARSWQWLSLLDGDTLADLNYALYGVLTYMPYTVQFIARELGRNANTPDELAKRAVEGSLIQKLKDATDYALNSIGRFNAALAPAIKVKRFQDLPVTVRDAARGPSQIRAQRKVKERIKIDEEILEWERKTGMLAMPSSMFAKQEKARTPITNPSVHGRSASLLSKLQSAEMPKAHNIISDEMIEGLNELDFSSAFDDDDDDAVIVRTIKREDLPAVMSDKPITSEQQQEKPQTIHTLLGYNKPPTLTLAQRLAQHAEKAKAAIPAPTPVQPKPAIERKVTLLSKLLKKD